MSTDRSRCLTALDEWTGDFEMLIGHTDEIADDQELCQRLFMSEQEAFCAGLFLGMRNAPEPRGHDSA
jgi:hypothetical protein